MMGGNPRLVSPSIDVPLASVQVERTDSLEMIPKPGGPAAAAAGIPAAITAGNYTFEYTNMSDREMLEEVVEQDGGMDSSNPDTMCELEECAEHCYLVVSMSESSNY